MMKATKEDERELLLDFGLYYKNLNDHGFLKVLFMVYELYLKRLKHFVLETLNCEVWR
jgi:hypothetical protein